ncbi:MAG: flavin reductase [Acidobacteria bacterium]|nr:MAG: flavin reductase [Acidobacteriota bacterium]
MSISSQAYRDALSRFPAGVCIVTARAGDKRHGMTVSAFVSVSASPPLVAVVIDQAHAINPLLRGERACFAVNVLAHDQRRLADRFAFVKDEDRFLEGRWSRAVTGAPILSDALAWLDCEVHSAQPAGSHTIYVGAVRASRLVRPQDAPLVYWKRGYRRLAPG